MGIRILSEEGATAAMIQLREREGFGVSEEGVAAKSVFFGVLERREIEKREFL